AVLGMRDGQQPLVAGQRVNTGIVVVGGHHFRTAAGAGEHARGAAVVRGADRGDRPADRHPGRVTGGHTGHRGLRSLTVWPAGERLTYPLTELVAVGVVEPPDVLAVRADRGVPGAVGPVGDLAVQVGGAVPGVDLPHPA